MSGTQTNMLILSIETSCDETAVSIIEASGTLTEPVFAVLGNALHSQAETHAEYGGVFPILAKREHARNLVPIFASCIEHARKSSAGSAASGAFTTFKANISEEKIKEIEIILEREHSLAEAFLTFTREHELPSIDAIAVTEGPGLEPALWVGINFARALAVALNKPIIPVNHMEGHIVSVLVASDSRKHTDEESLDTFSAATTAIVPQVNFPALALLISGGHTELVSIEGWHTYKVLGATKDDAVGEAFDKVARLLNLPYPGGPKISKLADESRAKGLLTKELWNFPRPMLKSDDYHFSFSGLKTSVLYAVKKKTEDADGKKISELNDTERATLAEEFENAVTEVLVTKTKRALEETSAQTLILGGGVIANTFIRKNFEELAASLNVKLFVPSIDLSTDNSIMIGIAGYLRYAADPKDSIIQPGVAIAARGNLSL